MLYIQPDECVDCGACEPVCPVEAIYYEDDVPGEFSEFKSINEEFFGELGSPGGASSWRSRERSPSSCGAPERVVKALVP